MAHICTLPLLQYNPTLGSAIAAGATDAVAGLANVAAAAAPVVNAVASDAATAASDVANAAATVVSGAVQVSANAAHNNYNQGTIPACRHRKFGAASSIIVGS